MHDERARRQRDRPAVEDDLAAGHVLDVSEANDVLDGAEQIELPRAERGGLGHRGDDVRVDPQHHAGGFEAQEEVVERLGLGGRRHGVRGQPERHRGVGLDDGAVEHPRVTRRTHMMRSGGTPFASSHTIPSVAVLPEPTIT